jgi:hypothetical protein
MRELIRKILSFQKNILLNILSLILMVKNSFEVYGIKKYRIVRGSYPIFISFKNKLKNILGSFRTCYVWNLIYRFFFNFTDFLRANSPIFWKIIWHRWWRAQTGHFSTDKPRLFLLGCFNFVANCILFKIRNCALRKLCMPPKWCLYIYVRNVGSSMNL